MDRFADFEQTLFAELVQRCLAASFDSDLPENGSFTQQERKGIAYWYYQGYEAGSSGSEGKRYAKYIGRADDPDVNRRVEAFRTLKADYQQRRKLVSLLRSAGFPRPPDVGGDVVDALRRGGLFRLGGVIVGTVAFQTYAGLLGVRLPTAQIITMDVDLAQFHGVSAAVDDSIPPALDTLQSADATFAPIPALDGSPAASSYRNADGFKVDFLTPNESSDDYAGHPTRMPALGGAFATPLRYLGLLIRDPVWSVLLHRGGVLVRVPAPWRFAVHKLILADIRKSDAHAMSKARKDMQQADLLLQALAITNNVGNLGDVWREAWSAGPRWRKRLTASLRELTPRARESLAAAASLAAVEDGVTADDLGMKAILGA